MVDLDAPVGAQGSVLLDELRDVFWRADPQPREAVVLLRAALPTGLLEVSCNAAVDEVVATLDGEQVGRLHDQALRPQTLVWDGAPGPAVELGDERGRVTWRLTGSLLRPLGRIRSFQVRLGERDYCYWKDAAHHPMSRRPTPDGDRVVVVGTSGVSLTDKARRNPTSHTQHALYWWPGTTTRELVLAELLTLGMTTRDLWSVQGKLLNAAAQDGRASDGGGDGGGD